MRVCWKVVLPPIVPTVNVDRTESRVKMTRMRMRIAERLKSAQNTAAMLTTFQEVGVVSFRMSEYSRRGGKVDETCDTKCGRFW